MENDIQQPYVVNTALSGVTNAAAFILTLSEVVYAQGRIEVGSEDPMEKELMALIEGLGCVPDGRDVVIRTRLEYIRNGCKAMLLSKGCLSTTAEANGPFSALWLNLASFRSRLGCIEIGRADRKDHDRCKALAATPEDHHELLNIEQQVLDQQDAANCYFADLHSGLVEPEDVPDEHSFALSGPDHEEPPSGN
jgi:hypothetical protein